MARRETAARRYAEAAFEVASADGALNRWQADLAVLGETLAIGELRAVMEHPAIPYAQKERVLRRAVTDVATGPMNLVLLMIRRGRPGAVPAMRSHFDELVRRQRGIARAEVRTALPLGDQDRADLERTLERLAGRQVEFTETVDPGLIGGISVRIGDRLYDASVRGRLERLRARLTTV
ncbi:MAG TPA: ATP synthase F1 subunit delta [Candidatus Limnocylindria bacterium]|jgi:F-type H+-transporting ATPase subunit delta